MLNFVHFKFCCDFSSWFSYSFVCSSCSKCFDLSGGDLEPAGRPRVYAPGKPGHRGGLRLHELQCVQEEKMCFLPNSLQPISRKHIDASKLSTQVHNHSYWLAIFWTTNSSTVLARESLQNYENSWKKKHKDLSILQYEVNFL